MKVAVGNTAEVSARDVFVRCGVSVFAGVFVAAGACVVAGGDVSLGDGWMVGAGVCPVQAERSKISRQIAMNDFWIILISPR